MNALRLVGGRGTPGAGAALRELALLGLEPELEAYVTRGLRTRWPKLRVLRHCRPGTQLCICDLAATAPSGTPTIVLDRIANGQRLQRVAPTLWKLMLPTSGHGLVQAIEQVLRPAVGEPAR